MSDRNPSEPYLGAFLGLACGDALGAPVEFMKRAEIESQHGRLTEMVGGGRFRWAPGEWTDDTGMALALAEGILAQPEDPMAHVGMRFLQWADTAKDVGATISAALANAEFQRDGRRPEPWASPEIVASRVLADQIDWAAASRSTPQAQSGRAAGNGSLMRTLPVALAYSDPQQMLDVSARISAMTHWDPQAEVSCAAYCLWIRELLLGLEPGQAWKTAVSAAQEVAAQGRRSSDTPGPSPLPENFWSRLEGAPAQRLEDLQPSGFAGYVVECLEAAVWTAVNAPTLEEAVVTLVNLGGETDTMAAVAGGAIGARFGVRAIPDRWLEALRQRERIEQVARDLYALRHQLVYSKPTLPGLSFRELEGGLLYGRNPLTAKDVETLLAEGVTRILDLREDHEWSKTGRSGREAIAALEWCGVRRDVVPIVDGGAPTYEQLDRTWQILSDLASDGATYVHCRAGIERTGAVIAAYLARRDGLCFDDTLHRLNKSNAGLYPLPFQAEAVQQWLDRVS